MISKITTGASKLVGVPIGGLYLIQGYTTLGMAPVFGVFSKDFASEARSQGKQQVQYGKKRLMMK